MASLPTNINCQPICQNCSTSTTPLWRRDENGSVLCNACGLFLKLHGRPRPISLKTDVIKSRNRVKTTGRGGVKKVGFYNSGILFTLFYRGGLSAKWLHQSSVLEEKSESVQSLQLKSDDIFLAKSRSHFVRNLSISI